MLKKAIGSLTVLLVSLGLALGAGEAILRVKNRAMTSYDIEMWRYARELKVPSDDRSLAFDHARSRSAVLQNVTIGLNEWGLRNGPVEPIPPGGRRVLFLGGSIALGWGVDEPHTVEAVLEQRLRQSGQRVQVLNGGVGNYNAERYVSRFFKELEGLAPTDLVVLYFLRDAEDLEPGGGNVFLRHSELAVMLWVAGHRLFDRHGEASLVEHYRGVYAPDAPGFRTMQVSLKRLADYAKARHIGLYLAMTPDVHNLTNYPFVFIHDTMRGIAEPLGYTYVDLLPALRGRTPAELFAMPGDPHPNGLGHQLMADALFPVIK